MMYGPSNVIGPWGHPFFGGLHGFHYDENYNPSINMAFELFTDDPCPEYVFGWKTADPYQPEPDPDYGWIDDAVSSTWVFWPTNPGWPAP